jgi:5-methylcytosine-specific restriction endonuclease McrA
MYQPIDFALWGSWNYQDYIRSEAWKARKAEAIHKAGYKCSKCGNIGKLECHHNAYNRLGAELDSDLLVVCEKCHKKIHNLRKGGE